MTRKDYVTLAKYLREVRPDRPAMFAGWYQAAKAIAEAMAAENPHGFDKGLFLRNCGIKE